MQPDTLNDENLVSQYIQGNEQAFELLVRRHKSKVFTSIFMFVRDRYVAEDLFQDTFIRVILTLRKGEYHEEGKFLPWVMRIANNICIDYYRKTKRLPHVTFSDGTDALEWMAVADTNPEKIIVRKQSHERIRALINRLPSDQREIVILRHWAELSFKEISEITGICISTCLGRMRYALINIRRLQKQKELVS